MNYPGFLVAVDVRRNRVFVLAKPNLMAVKKDGVWYYGEGISDQEIDRHYELVTDLNRAQKWIEEAKSEMKLL